MGLSDSIEEQNKIEMEILRAKVKQLEKTILDFGNNPVGFDWAVLDRIDKLQAKNEQLRKIIAGWLNWIYYLPDGWKPTKMIEESHQALKD